MEAEILKKIKKHWPTLVFSLTLGFLMVLPFFYFQTALGDEYNGILNQIIDDELFYLARIKDVIDGHPTLGNAYLLEHKNQLPQQLFLPEFLLAQPLKFLNLDIVQGRILYNFVLPAIVFILTYVALYLIYPSRLWANLFAVFLIFSFYLFKFTRPVIPQFVFIFWLTQFIFLWKLIKTPSNTKVKLLNILNFGLLFYFYPFYWTFYFVFIFILSFVYFFKDRELSKRFLKILIGGIIIGFFYFYLTFLAFQLPEYEETLTRLQLIYSRSPSEIKTVLPTFFVLTLISILYRLKIIKIDREILFFVVGIISILLVTNQNIITGQKFEFGHYRMPAVFFLAFAVYYLLVPYETARARPERNRTRPEQTRSYGTRNTSAVSYGARSVSSFRMGWSQVKLLNFKFKSLVVSLIIIVSVFGIYGYVQRVFNISDQDIYAQKYRIIFDWLNENTPKDSVVYADNNLSELIPVYTANNVFYTRAANLFFISDQEALGRFILNNYFEKFDRDFVIENERSIWGVRYVDRYGDAVQANKWRKLLGLGLKDETRLPEEEINKILAMARQIQKNSLGKGIKKYRVDYLVWDKEKSPHWLIPDSFEKVFEINELKVFKFNFTSTLMYECGNSPCPSHKNMI